MPRRRETATITTAWLGAPPVAANAFAFANGDFFAEASGQNQHRRATLAELNEHSLRGAIKTILHTGSKPS
ncbi:hypothetical protein FOCG_00006 [Fusarium oxysporum f. sp. radicis-lycopersici 26381]|nr:hypothetical protein FOCG_00006 [Fusarium oxysporum f. sp. radicis-lycopersici 26381]